MSPKAVAPLVPIAAAQIAGRRLHPDRHDMFTWRRERRVRDRRNGNFQERLLRKSSIFSVVCGAFQIIQRRTDMNDAAEGSRVVIVRALEIG